MESLARALSDAAADVYRVRDQPAEKQEKEGGERGGNQLQFVDGVIFVSSQ